jgi:hypothetical protein
MGSTWIATFSSPDIINIYPGSITPATYDISIQISDGINSPTFYLSVTVTANTAPTFDTTPVDQSTPAGVPITYTLPAYTDADDDSCTISLLSGGPNFVTLTAPNILNISPTLNDVGSTNV